MSLGDLIKTINETAVGWPVLIYVVAVCSICTVAFRFIQLRYFIAAWRFMLFPEKKGATGDMSPFQAFLNSLSVSLGNGSLAGVATAIYSGGPGAAFWIVAIGFIIMSARFAEVFLGTYFVAHSKTAVRMGGPMLYLKSVIGGRWLTGAYVFFGLLFCFVGNGIQTNSIGMSVHATWGITSIVTATLLLAFIAYVVLGGAARIIKVSDRLVPIKVFTFFGASAIVLVYHFHNILPALKLIVSSAFQPLALVGGVAGFTVQQAIKFGMLRSIMATESGLGTVAIFFGGSGSKEPVKSGIMSMLSTFISTVVCFLVALCIIISGVWNSGLTSTALTVAAYETVFGHYGGWIVSFLSIVFGMGVLVSYAYVTREFWFYITNYKFETLFSIIYSLVAFTSVFIDPTILFNLADLPNAGMLTINLFGILWLTPLIRREVIRFTQSQKAS